MGLQRNVFNEAFKTQTNKKNKPVEEPIHRAKPNRYVAFALNKHKYTVHPGFLFFYMYAATLGSQANKYTYLPMKPSHRKAI